MTTIIITYLITILVIAIFYFYEKTQNGNSLVGGKFGKKENKLKTNKTFERVRLTVVLINLAFLVATGILMLYSSVEILRDLVGGEKVAASDFSVIIATISTGLLLIFSRNLNNILKEWK